MNLTSTAKAPSAQTNWPETLNPVVGPEISDLVPPVLYDYQCGGDAEDVGTIIEVKNRTTSPTDDIYFGCVRIGPEKTFDIWRRYTPPWNLNNYELSVSEPTVLCVYVGCGISNTTFSFAATSTGLEQGIAELNSIALTIRSGLRPQPSGAFDALLDQALTAKGTPKHIDTWALRLARNVLDLND